MGTVIAVTSGKGGTGKTFLAGSVGCCLAALGARVLLIDMDIGLRNLDLTLGLSDRALMDFSDVLDGRCALAHAAVAHPLVPRLFLLTAPLSRPEYGFDRSAVRGLLSLARAEFDYVLIDSPAGLGEGFRLASFAADRVIVVSTNEPAALRDAQRTVAELTRQDEGRAVHLVVNRVQPRLMRRLHATIDDAMDTAGLPLLGVIPEDRQVYLAAHAGQPLILTSRRGAALACLNIAKRLAGRRVALMNIR